MPNYARFNGGPLDEQLHETPDEAGWPLPDEMVLALISGRTTFGMGRYIKLSESQLTDEQADHPGIGRGASYEWEEGAYAMEALADEAKHATREAWNESTREGVDLSYSASKPAPADWDPRTDYPERFTEGPV